MRLYNSRSRAVEAFQPRDGRVSMYVCGITPYDVTHLGHAFTYLTFDVLRRYLESRGLSVLHIQNVTDVDDDIIRKSRELDTTPRELTARNVAWFEEDMRALGALPPTVTPYASQEIDGIQTMIAKLLADGHAYTAEDGVYFDVSSFPSYGALSHLTPAEMMEENRRQKMRPGPRHPLDFLLWQAHIPGEPLVWASPWGRGRPGWHIECSAMALHHAGETLDIHGGGHDLIFPHHESEIAQSESYTAVAPFVRTWMHVGMIRYQGEKMSKSLGNLVLVRDLLRAHTADAVRLSLLDIHYRDSQEWTTAMMATADERAALLTAAAVAPAGKGEALDPAPFAARFRAALADDLNTPQAVTILCQLAERVVNVGEGWDVTPMQTALSELGALLGLRLVQNSEHA